MPTTKHARPRGRPPTGRTPDAERTAKVIKNLRASGGDVVRVLLPSESMDDLGVICASLGTDLATRGAKTDAVIHSLAQTAKAIRRKAGK